MTAVAGAAGPADRGGDLGDDRLVRPGTGPSRPDLDRAAELELPAPALEPQRNGVDDRLPSRSVDRDDPELRRDPLGDDHLVSAKPPSCVGELPRRPALELAERRPEALPGRRSRASPSIASTFPARAAATSPSRPRSCPDRRRRSSPAQRRRRDCRLARLPRRSRRARGPAASRRAARAAGVLMLGPARLVQLRVDRRAPSSPARPGTPSSSSWVASSIRSAEPKWWSSARRRAGPTPWSSSKIEPRASRSRRCRWKPSAKRCASSRMRCSSWRPGESRPSTIGSGAARDEHLLIRFASAITATRGRSNACIAASAADSWPLPPSMTTRFGVAANDSSCSSRGLVAEPREPPRDDLRHRREVVRPVERADAELPVVRLLRRPRPGRRPSSRPATRPGCWRCRSTRSGSAGSRG